MSDQTAAGAAAWIASEYPNDEGMAALLAQAELGAAWAEAEAALPEGWRLALRTNGRGTYVAEVLPKFLPYEEWMEARVEAYEDTPAAALRALAVKLRATYPLDNPRT